MNCLSGAKGGDPMVEEVQLALDKLWHIPIPKDLCSLKSWTKQGLE